MEQISGNTGNPSGDRQESGSGKPDNTGSYPPYPYGGYRQALKKTNAGGAHKETVRYDATVRAPQGQLPDENEFRCGFQSSAKNPGSGKFCPEKNADILPAGQPEGTVAA